MNAKISLFKRLFSNYPGLVKNQYKPLRIVIINFAFAVMLYIVCMAIALKNPNIDPYNPQHFLYGYFEVKFSRDGLAHNAISWIGWLLISLTVLELIVSITICFYLRHRYTKPFLINNFVIGSFILSFFGLITGIPVAFDENYLRMCQHVHDGSQAIPKTGHWWISTLFYLDVHVDEITKNITSVKLVHTWLYWFDTAFYIVFNILGQASNVFTLKKFYQKNFNK